MMAGEIQALRSALLWHLDVGVDAPLADTPRGLIGALSAPVIEKEKDSEKSNQAVPLLSTTPPASPPLGASEARICPVASCRSPAHLMMA